MRLPHALSPPTVGAASPDDARLGLGAHRAAPPSRGGKVACVPTRWDSAARPGVVGRLTAAAPDVALAAPAVVAHRRLPIRAPDPSPLRRQRGSFAVSTISIGPTAFLARPRARPLRPRGGAPSLHGDVGDAGRRPATATSALNTRGRPKVRVVGAEEARGAHERVRAPRRIARAGAPARAHLQVGGRRARSGPPSTREVVADAPVAPEVGWRRRRRRGPAWRLVPRGSRPTRGPVPAPVHWSVAAAR